MVEDLIKIRKNIVADIYNCRCDIADLKKQRIDKRANAWSNAEGIADAKKDYVRSQVSDIDCQIAILEADIESYYNQLSIIQDEIEWEYLKDE